MKVTNFPNGLPGAFFQGTYVQPNIAGKSNVFWVDSQNPLGNGNGSPGNPFSRVSYALPFCADNNGDVLYLAPSHHEDVQDSFAINVDGLSIIATGNENERASFSVSGALTTAGYVLAGDNMKIDGVRVLADVPGLVSPVTVTGKSNTIVNCKWTQEGYAPQYCINLSATANAVDGLTLAGNDFLVTTDTEVSPITPTAAIYLNGINDSVNIVGNKVRGKYSSAGILGLTAKALTNIFIVGNLVHNSNSTGDAINLVAATTGEAINNTLFGSVLFATGGAIFCSQNFGSATANNGSSQVPVAT